MLKLAPIVLLSATLAQQPGMPQRDSRSGLIVGQVIDAGSGQPVGGALVEISAQPLVESDRTQSLGALPALLTASDGRFVLRRLPAARYTITAIKAGYLEGAYGRRRPEGPGQTLLLSDGQKTGAIRVYLFRPAAVTGVVVDEAGEAVIGIQVRALRRILVAGQRRFAYTGPVGWTDDRGIYRIGGLPPGDYMVAATATQVSVPASTAQEVRQAGVPPGIEEIGAAATAGPTAIKVAESLVTLGRSAIGPAPSSDARLFVYPTTFHPDTPSPAKATVFALASGEERGGLDLHLLPIPTRRVSGTIAGDRIVGGVPIRIVPEDADDSPIDLEIASTITSRDGTFSFPAVPVGNHLIRAVTGLPVETNSATIIQTASGVEIASTDRMPSFSTVFRFFDTRWASQPLTVGRDDVGGVTVRLAMGIRVAGRVQFEGTTPRPALARLAQLPLSAVPASPTSRLPSFPARVSPPGGQFEMNSRLPGGRYLLRIGTPPGGWSLKSAISNGRDVTESALDLETGDVTDLIVTFTDRPTQIAGSVRNTNGTGDADATVLLFPTDPQTWVASTLSPRRFRLARAGPSGAYTINPVLPGEYFAVAVTDEQSADWQDPRTLDALSRVASTVTIAEGEKKTVDLRTREIR